MTSCQRHTVCGKALELYIIHSKRKICENFENFETSTKTPMKG